MAIPFSKGRNSESENVYFEDFKNLLQKHLANFNQTWDKTYRYYNEGHTK